MAIFRLSSEYSAVTMMMPMLLILIGTVLTSAVLAEHVSMEKYIQECNKTHPISKEKLFPEKATNATSLFKDTLKDNHNAQCLIKCIMNKYYVVDDKGNIIAAGLKNHLTEYEKSMKDYLKNNLKFNITLVDVKQVEEFVNKCKPKDENEEPCLKSYKLLVCLANENDQIQLKLNGTTPTSASATKSDATTASVKT